MPNNTRGRMKKKLMQVEGLIDNCLTYVAEVGQEFGEDRKEYFAQLCELAGYFDFIKKQVTSFKDSF